MLDAEALLAAVSPDQPCGANLEYDADFAQLTRLAQGKPEQRMGDKVVPAEPPDWRQVQKQAVALFGRTKDLRVATLLTRAQLQVEGLGGFGRGLALVRGMLERYWEPVHPQLDPDDDNDPTMRVNTLAELADAASVLAAVRAAPLVSARGLGRISLRDLEIVTGEAKPAAVEGEGEPKLPPVDAVFGACELSELQACAEAVQQAAEDVQAIERFVGEKVGSGAGPNLSKLTSLLQKAARVASEKLAQRGAGGGAAEPQAPAASGEVGAARAAPAPVSGFSGAIGSREDVVRALDAICAYYERFEPSSPIPILMQRSKRLVTMSFLDLVRDLAPDGVNQIENLRGKQE